MIKTNKLTKVFGDNKAVNELSLDISQGEFFAFLGPNAAGKTTTIKMLTGLLRPTSGRAFICGYDIQKDYVQAKALISYIPDVPYLYEKLTGKEFLEFVAGLYKLDRRESDKEADQLLEMFSLDRDKHKLIQDYSHGMRQKLVMCSAFLHHPQVIIIDEPMVGLDPRSSRLVKDVLKAKSGEGITIFMSTHTLSVAEELADCIGIIDRGRLIAVGTMDELKKISKKEGQLEDIFLELTRPDQE